MVSAREHRHVAKPGSFFSMPVSSAVHSEKDVESKNCDQNGPEGQFRAVNSTMCNAGFPP
jgi:hypothetical protein